MKKLIIGAACLTLVFLFQGGVLAQNVVPNGDFELKAQGQWDLIGNNNGASCVVYNTSGTGNSWCWRRAPGTPSGNGGLSMDIHLVGGVAYAINIDVCYLATC